MIRWLTDLFSRDIGPPLELDHVPVGALDCRTTEKIKAAAEKFGKPFKCGPDGILRERMVAETVPGKDGAPATIVMKPQVIRPKATVTPITRRTK